MYFGDNSLGAMPLPNIEKLKVFDSYYARRRMEAKAMRADSSNKLPAGYEFTQAAASLQTTPRLLPGFLSLLLRNSDDTGSLFRLASQLSFKLEGFESGLVPVDGDGGQEKFLPIFIKNQLVRGYVFIRSGRCH